MEDINKIILEELTKKTIQIISLEYDYRYGPSIYVAISGPLTSEFRLFISDEIANKIQKIVMNNEQNTNKN